VRRFLHGQRDDALGDRGIAFVPTRSALSNTICARQTCF
jgi:hypothetical protein